MNECKFCGGKGKVRYFDFKKCHETCGNTECKLGFDCPIAAGIDKCPDCNGTGICFVSNKIQ